MEERTEAGHVGKKETLNLTGFVLVIDVEANCCPLGSVPQQQMETIQIGAVIATLSGEVMGEWNSHVRPIRHPVLTTFCTQLTGIRQSDVDTADVFPSVIKDWDSGSTIPAQPLNAGCRGARTTVISYNRTSPSMVCPGAYRQLT